MLLCAKSRKDCPASFGSAIVCPAVVTALSALILIAFDLLLLLFSATRSPECLHNSLTNSQAHWARDRDWDRGSPSTGPHILRHPWPAPSGDFRNLLAGPAEGKGLTI